MATIAETLIEIEQIQEEFKTVINDDSLIDDLMSFSTLIYFEYTAHVVLENCQKINLSNIPFAKKYYELFQKEDLLENYIRYNNVGQFFVIWNAYEKYLRKKYLEDLGLTKFNIEKLFIDLTHQLRIERKEQTIEEFNVMRHTRNSFHNGTTFNPTYESFEGTLCGETFYFVPGELVKPLRIINVIKTMWEHYKRLEKTNVA